MTLSESIELINCIILSVKFALSASSVFSYLLTIQPDNVVLVLHKSSPNLDLAAFKIFNPLSILASFFNGSKYFPRIATLMTEVFTFVPKVSQREAAFKEYPLFVSLLISNNNLGQFSLTVMLFTLSLVSHLLVQVLISANISIIDILSSKGYVTKNSFLYFCSSSNLPLAFNNSKCA